ncbi:hypothetical protein IH779_03245 [Patescibacteria group bacterium]|nr:hypothetical protein [Patescibacteria group bacterium]
MSQIVQPEILKEVNLVRLRRLVRLLKEYDGELIEAGKMLLKRSIFSSYFALRDLACEERVDAVLANVSEEYLRKA